MLHLDDTSSHISVSPVFADAVSKGEGCAGGCGPSVDIYQAAKDGNIKAVKQHLASVRVNNPSP